jgi:hypothetical protein
MIYLSLKYQGKAPLYNQYTLYKNKRQKGNTGIFQGWIPVERAEHKERVNEGEYCVCILY